MVDPYSCVRCKNRPCLSSEQKKLSVCEHGIAYYHDGRIDDAVRFFQRAIALDGHAESHYYLGVIFSEAGDEDRAINHFRTRVRLRQGKNDVFAEEARKNLLELLEQKESRNR